MRQLFSVRRILRLCVPAVLLLAGFSSQLAAAKKETLSDKPNTGPLTINELFRPALLGPAALSPDGSQLGIIITGVDHLQSLVFIDLETYTKEVIQAGYGREVSSFRWINDREFLYSLVEDKIYASGLFRAKLREPTLVRGINTSDVTRVIGIPRNRPDRAIVWILHSHYNTDGSLLELKTEYNTIPFNRHAFPKADEPPQTYEPPPDGTVIDWLALDNGELGYCYTYHARQTLLHRYDSRGKGTWHRVNLDLEHYNVVAVDPDCHSLWVSHYTSARGFLLQRYDPLNDSFEEPILADTEYDLSGAHLYFSEKTKQLAGLTYFQRKSKAVWFQEPFASGHDVLRERNPDADVVLLSFDESEQKLLYLVTGAQNPGRLVLLNLAEKKWKLINTLAPWLQGRPFQPTQPVHYQTRDGLKQEGYLTLPADASAQHKVPLVILPHGGPWVRDRWEFDPTVQFLASRGYAVFQPNYRGSSGYIPSISEEDRYDFRKMRDDVTDAARAISALEMIDGSRLAIMGGSFGGYLALAGVTFEPGLYRCAVSFAGVFDWERLVKDVRKNGRPGLYEQLRDNLGQPGKDRESLAKYSPLSHIAAIKSPVFIAHGREDNIVDVAQSKMLVAALRKQGSPYEVFLIDDTAHGPGPLESRYEYHRKVEAFLARYLRDAAPQKP